MGVGAPICRRIFVFQLDYSNIFHRFQVILQKSEKEARRVLRSKTLAEGEFTSPEHFNFLPESKKEVTTYVVTSFLERATRLELATRHPANRLAAIRRNPASPPIQCAFGAGGGSELFSINKKQDTQTGCPASTWSGRRGSNSLPPPWQGGALPDELRPRNKENYTRHFSVCQDGIPKFH